VDLFVYYDRKIEKFLVEVNRLKVNTTEDDATIMMIIAIKITG
jgi:hypothetical protein